MTERGFGLYVHWPFCQAKCPYCDFNSHVTAAVDHTRWQAALVAEIARYAEETRDLTLSSIFFGGGTPSLMAAETVDAVIDAARRRWRCVNDIEITLEANPTSVEAGRFRDLANAGVNRVSVGIQALRDDALKALGRLHSATEARRAFETANAVFERVSFDIIYARQHQTLSEWREELTEALGMAAGHLSLYQLTIEDGTAFGDRYARGKLKGLPGDDLAADMYDLTQELTSAAGYDAYEISNHARGGAESRHNLTYWRSGEWVGVGPGAHGRLSLQGTRVATEALRSPAAWLAAAERGNGEVHREILSEQAIYEERLLMGLRLAEGIEIDNLSNEIIELIDSGLLEQHLGHRVRTTVQGRPLLNSILRQLLT